MKAERKELIETFEKMLATNPRKSIVGAMCANIAEAYAKQQGEVKHNRCGNFSLESNVECEHSILTTPTSTGTYHKQCYKCGKQF